MDNISQEKLNTVIENLKQRNINVIVLDSKEQVLDTVLSLVPEGAEIMNGSSTTLIETGVIDYIAKSNDRFKNLHTAILEEQDQAKSDELRRISVTADVFLGSVNAITSDGVLVAVDNTGSRVGAYLYAAKKLVLVSGINKIVDGDIAAAMKHVTEVVLPLESERAHKAYGVERSYTNKWMIIEKEVKPDRIHLVLVKEHLGF